MLRPLTSPIITMVVGRDQRLFAAHEDILCRSPFFAATLKGQFFEAGTKKVKLPDEYDHLRPYAFYGLLICI
jgi:hypothetical protein